MRSTLGESLVAVLMAGVAAFFAAILGFVGAAWLCSALLSGEMGEWGLVRAADRPDCSNSRLQSSTKSAVT
jgi:hypothetical protein